MTRMILGAFTVFFSISMAFSVVSSVALAKSAPAKAEKVAAKVEGSPVNLNYTAVVYEQNSSKQKELYKFKVQTTSVDGKDEISAQYTDLDGNVVIDQKTVLEGSKIVRDEIQQKQTNEVGIMEVKDGKIFFSKTSDGKTKTKEEKLGDTFVVSSNFQRFVKDNWADISAGKTVAFRYGVWDRQETVGFEIFKTGTETIGSNEALVLKMKPSSFIIAAIVNPIIFKFKADGSALLEMNGRTAPKKLEGKKYKDLDAEIVYTYL